MELKKEESDGGLHPKCVFIQSVCNFFFQQNFVDSREEAPFYDHENFVEYDSDGMKRRGEEKSICVCVRSHSSIIIFIPVLL